MTNALFDLLDLMVQPAKTLPVDPIGEVVTGQVDHSFQLKQGKSSRVIAAIEIHQCRASGKWMWGTSYHVHAGGSGYRVGPKWGQFADAASDALHWAKRELSQCIADRATPKEKSDITAWAERLSI